MLPIKRHNYRFPVQPGFTPAGFLANRFTDALHPFLRSSRALFSFTLNFSFVIMFRIVSKASSALLRQQITRDGFFVEAGPLGTETSRTAKYCKGRRTEV
jgi:hypothetical protein